MNLQKELTKNLYGDCPSCCADNDGNLCYYHKKISDGLIEEPDVEFSFDDLDLIISSRVDIVDKIASSLAGSNMKLKEELISEGYVHLARS